MPIERIYMSDTGVFPVRGYVKSFDSFKNIRNWQSCVEYLLDQQRVGVDTRNGKLSCKTDDCADVELENVEQVVEHFFGHLKLEADRYELLTEKGVFDFIEDFINHKFWSFEKDFLRYFPHPEKLKFSFFYSRGDIEPYVLLDEQFVQQIYGSNFNLMEVCHFASPEGLKNLQDSIENGEVFDISTMTAKAREFFDNKSNIEIRLIGNVRAAFRSDAKTLAVDSGHRAANLMRFEYPGRDKTNLCYDLSGCDTELRTGIWNEIVVTPVKILSHGFVKKLN